MIGRRFGSRLVRLSSLVGLGVLLLGVPAWAAPTSPQRSARSAALEQDAQTARALLQAATRAGQTLTYSGTQYAASWRDGHSQERLDEVRHDSVRGAQTSPSVTPSLSPSIAPSMSPSVGSSVAPTAVLDPRLIAVLAERYALRVTGPGRCAGRPTWIVEARTANDRVAGRFWIDRTTALVLRREVYDEQGARVLSSGFVDVAVGDAPALPVVLPPAQAAPGAGLPTELPGGYVLFDSAIMTPRPGQQVRHQAYSNGLSTVSIFVQSGQLGSAAVPGFTPDLVGERPVWVSHSWLERVVWSGGGKVFTLVSDASPASVRAAVEALPRDAAPDTGILARLGRGFARLAGMLNPFD